MSAIATMARGSSTVSGSGSKLLAPADSGATADLRIETGTAMLLLSNGLVPELSDATLKTDTSIVR
jgi:hypothetical protein